MFLSDKERIESILACRFCPMCQVADRLAGLLCRESYTPRGRAAILFALEKGLLKWDDAVADIMYTTINDGLLQQWCVGNYDHEELVLDARARLFEKALAPEAVQAFVNVLKARRSPGASPADVLRNAGIEAESGSKTLLYCGCSAREHGNETIVAMGRLFHMAQVRFQVLPHETCCGWPLYQLGDLQGAKEFSVEVANAIRHSGASTVVVLDADCYRMLLTRSSRFGGDLKGITVLHASGLLAQWVESGRIPIERHLPEKITYHDPCALARYCEDMESPRKVLSAICEKPLREMETHGKLANCCGGGGMLSVHRPDLSREVARLRLQEAAETGASIVATSCTRCVASFSSGVSIDEAAMPQAINLVDLVAAAAGL